MSVKKKKKKKKKKPRGKAKGSAFERQVCKDIVAAFKAIPQDAYRSILSGGHADSFGDISLSSALAKKFPFAVECKWYSWVNLHDLHVPWAKMNPHEGRFKIWWKQTIEGAQKCTRAPLLVFKANLQPVMCAVLLSDLKSKQKESLMSGSYTLTYGPRKPKGSTHRILVVQWKAFLKSCVKARK